MIELKHGDRVRLASWTHFPTNLTTVRVGTARGYAAEHREDQEESHARALARGHATAWTDYLGGALLGSASERQAQFQRELADLERSVALMPGDVVQIEAEAFVVHVPAGNLSGPRNSDPIKFVRVPAVA